MTGALEEFLRKKERRRYQLIHYWENIEPIFPENTKIGQRIRDTLNDEILIKLGIPTTLFSRRTN